MSPQTRTPQQRDRRFNRVRRLTQVIFVGAGAVSAALVGFVAANADMLGGVLDVVFLLYIMCKKSIAGLE